MKKILVNVLALTTPLMAMADGIDIETIIIRIGNIIKLIIPVLMLVAVAVFLYGIVKFIYAGGNENEKKEAKNYIIYGLIGIFVLVAFWGIIQIILNTFMGGGAGGPIPFPVIPGV